MERVMKRQELVDELSARTGFFKHNVDTMLDALDDIIVENMSMATKQEPSEIRLSLGFVFGGRYSPKREVRDPRTGEKVMTPAKFIPYARFSPSFRKKINKK
jgi:nucleoid DNA-binding protein